MDGTGFWRVYCEEWTVVYVSDALGSAAERECYARFEFICGQAKDGTKWRAVPWSADDPEGWPWMLEILLPVMKGEYRWEANATSSAAETDGVVVREGSAEDLKMSQRVKTMTRRGSG